MRIFLGLIATFAVWLISSSVLYFTVAAVHRWWSTIPHMPFSTAMGITIYSLIGTTILVIITAFTKELLR